MQKDDLALTESAKRVLERRYLAKDERGKVVEKPEEMFRRVAKNIAKADKFYEKSKHFRTLSVTVKLPFIKVYEIFTQFCSLIEKVPLMLSPRRIH